MRRFFTELGLGLFVVGVGLLVAPWLFKFLSWYVNWVIDFRFR